MNTIEMMRIATETAEKYLFYLLTLHSEFSDLEKELIKTTFQAGFSSGCRWAITGSERTLLDDIMEIQ